MKRIILCDIDGTLATIGDRAKILEKDKLTEKEYDEFNAQSESSSCIEDIANIIRNLKDSETKIYLITAREKKWKKITQSWLKLNEIPYDNLLMRNDGDKNSDADVKLKIVKEYVNPKRVWFVLEDRDDVVQMYREDLGLTCLQVNKGDY
tara:strand:+ start:230 stop:679 length:450 start_codon:yes stop_codon:yes gene_type:complete